MDGNDTLVLQQTPEWMEQPVVNDPGKQMGQVSRQKFRLCVDKNPKRLHSEIWAMWEVLLATFARLGKQPVCMADLLVAGCPYGLQDFKWDREKDFIEELAS